MRGRGASVLASALEKKLAGFNWCAAAGARAAAGAQAVPCSQPCVYTHRQTGQPGIAVRSLRTNFEGYYSAVGSSTAAVRTSMYLGRFPDVTSDTVCSHSPRSCSFSNSWAAAKRHRHEEQTLRQSLLLGWLAFLAQDAPRHSIAQHRTARSSTSQSSRLRPLPDSFRAFAWRSARRAVMSWLSCRRARALRSSTCT